MLPNGDHDYLLSRAPEHTVSIDSGMIAIVIPSFPVPDGLSVSVADLLLRLAPGYPDVPPDMWWFSPSIQRLDGRVITATDVQENYLGRTWQRWSRHLNSGWWRPGVDSLESYLALVRRELETAAIASAA